MRQRGDLPLLTRTRQRGICPTNPNALARGTTGDASFTWVVSERLPLADAFGLVWLTFGLVWLNRLCRFASKADVLVPIGIIESREICS